MSLELRSHAQELVSGNGLSMNGLSMNGLSMNGLSSAAFADWFQQDPAVTSVVMRYLVLCAVPAGDSRSYTNTSTGQSYTWNGGMGLTPKWASGQPISAVEQQAITACLLAHINRYGEPIPISILGRTAEGVPIPRSSSELSNYSIREACYFGNLFNEGGLFFGVDRAVDDQDDYLSRLCGVDDDQGGDQDGDDGGDQDENDPVTSCEPLAFIGSCRQYCIRERNGPSFTSCTYNGVTYHPLTTRMRESDYDRLFENAQ